MIKKIKEKIIFHLITKTAYLILYLIPVTMKFKEKNTGYMDKIGEEKVIFALWHNRFFIMPYYCNVLKQKNRLAGLASRSKDGKFIGKVLEMFNFRVVHGSSKKGGDVALKQLSRVITEENYAAAITVDGPTGPIYEIKPGIIKLAAMTQAPIVPISCYFKNYFCISKSWDKFLIPKPFTTCFMSIGDPIWVKEDISKEETKKIQKTLAESLHSLSKEN